MPPVRFGLVAILYFVVSTIAQQVYRLPPDLHDGPVDVELTSTALGQYDFFKLDPGINDKAWDSWFFDAVNPHGNESILVLMNAIKPGSEDITPSKTPYHTTIAGTFANGSSFIYGLDSYEAVIVQRSDKSMSLDFLGGQGDIGFHGSSTLEEDLQYVLHVNSEALGIHGCLTLKSRSPAHFACSPDAVNFTEVLVPGLAWSNAIPDSDIRLELTIGDTRESWSGTGYHDKVWGTKGLSPETMQSFYWGRGRLGEEYSIVWWSIREQNGRIIGSAYVAKSGKILLASCIGKAVAVQAWGEGSVFPPVPGTPAPDGFVVTFDLGNQGILVANLTVDLFLVEGPTVYFGVGDLSGGLVNDEDVLDGRAIWQVLQFQPSS